MADLRAQLRRNVDALRLVLSRDPRADVDRWACEIAELHKLTATSMSFGSTADHAHNQSESLDLLRSYDIGAIVDGPESGKNHAN